jgi:iron-sulfur cluster repair protein YtfE (RIC family)
MQDSPPADLRGVVESIAADVGAHVRREEDVVFPAMREAGVDADALGARLEDARRHASSPNGV